MSKTKKKPAPNTYIKKLGLEPAPERTPTVLRRRIRTLKANVKAGKYRGKLLDRAEHYIDYYQKDLQKKAG